MPDLFGGTRYEPKNQSILRLLEDFEKTYEPIFQHAKTEWNTRIREYMRDATGLKLNAGRRGDHPRADAGISIVFVPDCEDRFVKLVDEHFPDLDFAEYSSLRRLDEACKQSLPFFWEDTSHGSGIREVLHHCGAYFARYDLDRIVDLLFSKPGPSTDVWGAYYLEAGRVELFYLPLIVFAQLRNIDLEMAFAIVLTHELAHAYHHRGRDRDGYEWEEMHRTEKKVVEGLAQYFTRGFVDEYSQDYRRLREAYNSLIEVQSGPYRAHEEWKECSAEHVRSALFAIRRKGVLEYESFWHELVEARRILG